jgi:hypothetical protein
MRETGEIPSLFSFVWPYFNGSLTQKRVYGEN